MCGLFTFLGCTGSYVAFEDLERMASHVDFKSYRILLCIMRQHVLGPNFQ